MCAYTCVCVCVCVRACVHACARACVRVCVPYFFVGCVDVVMVAVLTSRFGVQSDRIIMICWWGGGWGREDKVVITGKLSSSPCHTLYGSED